MKITTTLLFAFVSLSVFSQSVDTLKSIKALETKLKSLNAELTNRIETVSKVTQLNASLIDSLQKQTVVNSNEIAGANRQLGIKISNTESSINQKIQTLDNSLSKSTLYWVIAFLATVLLSGVVYFLLGKRIKTGKSDVEEQISKTKKVLEEEGIKLDTKLTEVLETQLKIVQAERNTAAASNTEEADHSLALKVADEIMRINKNLSNMDANTKGLKQLGASVKRIEDNFAANGYEMPELLNKPFDKRDKMIANMVEDDNLEKGKEMITKIIKPQVNFRGIMIQAAQVEVSVGTK
ncbi:hypothetical protein ACFOW1_12240 [Parasediminibacterium paludis]|uniref:Septum formation initiator n=1 Tax=Parasediminibacterium paludis TaxID=908966 RepID=A0ABV8PX28_9BACT